MAHGDEAVAQLSWLTQGRASLTEDSIRFQTLAAVCSWNDAALRARFLEGLHHSISEEIAALDLPSELEELTSLCLRVESRLKRESASALNHPGVHGTLSPRLLLYVLNPCNPRLHSPQTAAKGAAPPPGAVFVLRRAGPPGGLVPAKWVLSPVVR